MRRDERQSRKSEEKMKLETEKVETNRKKLVF